MPGQNIDTQAHRETIASSLTLITPRVRIAHWLSRTAAKFCQQLLFFSKCIILRLKRAEAGTTEGSAASVKLSDGKVSLTCGVPVWRGMACSNCVASGRVCVCVCVCAFCSLPHARGQSRMRGEAVECSHTVVIIACSWVCVSLPDRSPACWVRVSLPRQVSCLLCTCQSSRQVSCLLCTCLPDRSRVCCWVRVSLPDRSPAC